jgi:malate dehydrogenase (decarboxylating)
MTGVFNDDIQGTAATALAGLYGALRVQGLPPAALARQRFVVVGAGSAGMGVAKMIAAAMERHGLSAAEAAAAFHVIDADGLVTAARPGLPEHVLQFARRDTASVDGEPLAAVVARTKPTVLLGLAGAGRLFSDAALKSMAENNARPIIMPMSNPTSKAEATHAQVRAVCGPAAIFASGSPQPDVESHGVHCAASQSNNMHLFPGLALGAWLARGNVVSDGMIMAAAEALVDRLTPEEVAAGRIYPSLAHIRETSVKIASATLKQALSEGAVSSRGAAHAAAAGGAECEGFVRRHMFSAEYTSLVPRF